MEHDGRNRPSTEEQNTCRGLCRVCCNGLRWCRPLDLQLLLQTLLLCHAGAGGGDDGGNGTRPGHAGGQASPWTAWRVLVPACLDVSPAKQRRPEQCYKVQALAKSSFFLSQNTHHATSGPLCIHNQGWLDTPACGHSYTQAGARAGRQSICLLAMSCSQSDDAHCMLIISP